MTILYKELKEWNENKAQFKRLSFHVPNLIPTIKYMKRSMFESIKSDMSNLGRQMNEDLALWRDFVSNVELHMSPPPAPAPGVTPWNSWVCAARPPVPERMINANPRLKILFYFCIYLPVHSLESDSMLSSLYLGVKTRKQFVSLSNMFLDKKTLLTI